MDPMLTATGEGYEHYLDSVFDLYLRYRADALAHAHSQLGDTSAGRHAVELLQATTYPTTRDEFVSYVGAMPSGQREAFFDRLRKGYIPSRTAESEASGRRTAGERFRADIDVLTEKNRDLFAIVVQASLAAARSDEQTEPFVRRG